MKRLFFISLYFLPITCLAQSLLPNGGFEDENICTEYVINCVPEAWISNQRGLTNYFTDSNRSYDGKHCMAIEAGHATRPFERTYIRSELLCMPKKGNKYRIEFFIKSPHAILDSIGVRFDSAEPLLDKTTMQGVAASVYAASNPANKFKKDSSWQKVILEYTATGTEKFMRIANFSKKDVTGSTGISRRYSFYVYIDNISMIPLNPAERLCANWQDVKKDIYNMNERHQYLERVLRLRQTNPAKKVQPGPVTGTD
jgi:hypothetical protein